MHQNCIQHLLPPLLVLFEWQPPRNPSPGNLLRSLGDATPPSPNPSTLFTHPQTKSNPLFPGSSREILGTSLPEPTTGASSELFSSGRRYFSCRRTFSQS
ncbi:hypothetical protein NPIL_144771 [Nephila pilipes]|uniref:Uncharacterized protein n=1 Tax=Nephila pilipes TaxID=299642 RepID=A0A8X6PSL6_NEPPI|nr:hypothetical protein NPIL_144771 [Nephila pilipes]